MPSETSEVYHNPIDVQCSVIRSKYQNCVLPLPYDDMKLDSYNNTHDNTKDDRIDNNTHDNTEMIKLTIIPMITPKW